MHAHSSETVLSCKCYVRISATALFTAKACNGTAQRVCAHRQAPHHTHIALHSVHHCCACRYLLHSHRTAQRAPLLRVLLLATLALHCTACTTAARGVTCYTATAFCIAYLALRACPSHALHAKHHIDPRDKTDPGTSVCRPMLRSIG